MSRACAATLILLTTFPGVLCESRDEWGTNWVWVLLPLLLLALIFFAFAIFRALHFRKLLIKAHEAMKQQQRAVKVEPTVLSERSITASSMADGPDTIALQRNQERVRQLEQDNSRLREENSRLKDELNIALTQLQQSRQELHKAMVAAPQVVERLVEVEKVVQVSVPQIVEVRVPQPVEVPKVVEKTVEVQRLVVDKAAEIQLQYAHDDIEYLKKELQAAKEKESLRRSLAGHGFGTDSEDGLYPSAVEPHQFAVTIPRDSDRSPLLLTNSIHPYMSPTDSYASWPAQQFYESV